MLLAGDESGHSQQGNNNAYCQDNELTWLELGAVARGRRTLLAFTRELIRLRCSHRVFRRRSFFQNRAIRGESGARHRVAGSGRHADDRTAMGRELRAQSRRVPFRSRR